MQCMGSIDISTRRGYNRHAYCPGCGLPFDPTLIRFNVDPEADNSYRYDLTRLGAKCVLWIADFRTVSFGTEILENFRDETQDETYNILRDRNVTISIAVMIGDKCRAILRSPRLSFITFERELVSSLQNQNTYFLLPIHDICLSILNQILCIRARDASAHVREIDHGDGVVRTLIEFLEAARETRNRTPLKGGGAENMGKRHPGVPWANDYYGAKGFWVFSGWICQNGSEWIAADPERDCSTYFDELVFRLDAPTSSSQDIVRPVPPSNIQVCHSERSTIKYTSTLEALPDLVLSALIKFLPIASVLNLQRCSKALYTTLPILPKFWRDRLITGELVPWAWELQDRTTSSSILHKHDLAKDWKLFARSLNSLEPEEYIPGEPLFLRNRRRIWGVLSDVQRVL